ncbi:replication/maintenance protein RepL [Heyndrickxia coagulans]|uniref:replication/maintenance protein RepL n=1 Tax=Heyndrickxia coagulans TaxID=1398 RepID=UPI0007795C5F|nr:replication/maintenance protein RepL [Heyndrickxia coagulans]
MRELNSNITNMKDYKKPKTTRKKVKFLGTKEFIDKETGEIHKMQVTDIEERDANFHKIWLGHMLESLDMIGNQKIRVAMFILNNVNKENEFIMTYRVIAEKTGISLQTITETMKALQESNFLKKIRNGYYRLNPDIIFKGGKEDRLEVLIRYNKGE